MPIPSPTGTEKKESFIQRCMSDSTMVKEYPDASQRFAICQNAWKEVKGAFTIKKLDI